MQSKVHHHVVQYAVEQVIVHQLLLHHAAVVVCTGILVLAIVAFQPEILIGEEPLHTVALNHQLVQTAVGILVHLVHHCGKSIAVMATHQEGFHIVGHEVMQQAGILADIHLLELQQRIVVRELVAI